MGCLNPSKAAPGSVAVLTLVEVTWPPAPKFCALGLPTLVGVFLRVALQTVAFPTFKDFPQGNPHLRDAIRVVGVLAYVR